MLSLPVSINGKGSLKADSTLLNNTITVLGDHSMFSKVLCLPKGQGCVKRSGSLCIPAPPVPMKPGRGTEDIRVHGPAIEPTALELFPTDAQQIQSLVTTHGGFREVKPSASTPGEFHPQWKQGHLILAGQCCLPH